MPYSLKAQNSKNFKTPFFLNNIILTKQTGVFPYTALLFKCFIIIVYVCCDILLDAP